MCTYTHTYTLCVCPNIGDTHKLAVDRLHFQRMLWLFNTHICWLMFSYFSVRYVYIFADHLQGNFEVLADKIPLASCGWLSFDRSFSRGRSSCKRLGEFWRNASFAVAGIWKKCSTKISCSFMLIPSCAGLRRF